MSERIALVGSRIKAKVGDVFEVTLRDGRLAYVQMVAESPVGDVARVLAGRHVSPLPDLQPLVAAPHEYLIYAMLGQLARDGLARRAGNWAVPNGLWSGLKLSPRYDKSRRLEGWVVTDGRVARQRLDSLPDSLRKELPIWQVGDSWHVVDMLAASSSGGLESGELAAWRGEHGLGSDSGDTPDPAEEAPGVQHFALFPQGDRLDGVIAELAGRGFSCTIVTDLDVEGQLLVINAEPSAPGFIDDQWDRVEEVVKAAGGEYDGWEASTHRPRP